MTYATLYPTRAAAEAAAAAYAQSIRADWTVATAAPDRDFGMGVLAPAVRAQAPADARLCLIEATARGPFARGGADDRGAARTVRLFAYLQSPAS